MNRTLLAVAASGLAIAALPGCLFISGSSSGRSSYSSYYTTTKSGMDSMIAANTQNRLGDSREVVLGRFPATYLTLVHTQALGPDREVAVYRVYAKEKHRSTYFRRYLVFENDKLALLTHDDDAVNAYCGADVDLD